MCLEQQLSPARRNKKLFRCPKKEEVSNKNINSNNCYETTTTRVVASLFRESFSDVCIYDCCIFVYHILFSSVCMSTRQVTWLTIPFHIQAFMYVSVYMSVQRFPQPWRKVRRGQGSSSFFILLYDLCNAIIVEREGKADDNGDFRPSFSYRMLNQMQRLKYDRKSHTHTYSHSIVISMCGWVTMCVCMYMQAYNKNLFSTFFFWRHFYDAIFFRNMKKKKTINIAKHTCTSQEIF